VSPPEFSKSRKNIQTCSSSTEQPGASMSHGWDGNWGSMMSSGIIVYPLTRLSLQEGNRRFCTNILGDLLRMKLWTHMKHMRMIYETYIYKEGRQTHIILATTTFHRLLVGCLVLFFLFSHLVNKIKVSSTRENLIVHWYWHAQGL